MISNHRLRVTLIIPSYKRPLLLIHTVKAFASQLCRNDEIIVIVHSCDPFRDKYGKLIKEIRTNVHVRLIINPSNSLSHSYNLGLRAASNEILLFSDDDCIPDDHLIENHLSVYERYGNKVIGVTGRITTAVIKRDRIVPIIDRPLFPIHRAWNKPIAGMESWFFFITQGGRLYMRGNPEYWLGRGAKLLLSLPIGGGNMSFGRQYLRNIFLDEKQKRAFRFEQLLFLKVWKSISEKRDMSSHRFVLNLAANTFHVQNVEGTTSRPRNIRDSIELAIESAKSSFKFKSLLPKTILFRALLRELLIHLIKVLFYSIRVSSRRDASDWQTPARYTGEFIGSLVGLFVGIAHYASWCFDDDMPGASFRRDDS